MKKLCLKREEIYRGNLILVNREHRYVERRQESDSFGGDAVRKEQRLVSVGGGQQSVLLENTAARQLNLLMSEINGWAEIVPVSGWRSFREQQEIWDGSLKENGQKFTETYVAVPGHSEHQTGLAIDLGFKQEEIDFIRPEFPDAGICRIFREKAAGYGFIERYPAEKETITKIGHEPWHFRYVGVPHAAIMKEWGFTLEEYIPFIRHFGFGMNPYTFREGTEIVMVSYIRAVGEVTEAEISESSVYSLSGDNIDGFILTERRQINEKT